MTKDKNYRALLGRARWASLARRVKTEAMWTCSRCGRTTHRLAVHHITPVETARSPAEMERLAYDESNLQVLCYDCHAEVHKSMRLSAKATTQERATQHVDRLAAALGLEMNG